MGETGNYSAGLEYLIETCESILHNFVEDSVGNSVIFFYEENLWYCVGRRLNK